MGEIPESGRRFSEKQADAILRRAVEMQAGRLGAESGGRGISLDQLCNSAGEIGVNPDFVRRAAEEVAHEGERGGLTRFFGGPWTFNADRIVPGNVDPTEWPQLLAELRAVSKRVGEPSTVGNSFEWISRQPDGLHVALTPGPDGTRVRIAANFGQWAGVYMGVPIAAAFPIGLSLSLINDLFATPAVAALAVLGLPAIAFLVGRRAFSNFCARRKRETQSLLTAIETWISARGQAPVSAGTLAHHFVDAEASPKIEIKT